MSKTILVIDDNADYRDVISNILLDHGYDVYEASCPDDAYQILLQRETDLIICDLHMPFTMGEDRAEFLESPVVGIRTIKELSLALPKVRIIAITATSNYDLVKFSEELYPIPTLTKPFKQEDLLFLVETELGAEVSAAFH